MKRISFLPVLFIILCVAGAKAQNLDLYQKRLFISKADTLPYRILYPENFDPGKKYPVMLFLHGRGESGKDNQKQLTHGGKMFLRDSIRSRHSAIVIFPQCPADSYWANVNIVTDSSGKRHFNFIEGGEPTLAMQMLLDFTNDFLRNPFVDKRRVYVGGLSMGGMGTFEILRRKDKTFAASFAICGGDHIANVKKYRRVPLWVFHGGKDDVVPPKHSEVVVNEMKKLGGSVRYTHYANANHNSWDPAFAEPGLLNWLFSHEKKSWLRRLFN
ncbi:prolyl oligopeptidase family serine peptidase [Desertivirga brevis]|uniref:carboxylesterase family protein n=1 Tax=Desertivirga brevis TaxID=2810310 RepID=UPI001A97606C|nr:prolyl oligopeptidase family serine peptidase [Pedobacter sp. SYSU D00873]